MANVITNVKGTPIVSFEDQRDLGQEYLRNNIDVGIRKTNPDGSIARSKYHSAAVNMDWFFENRYRVVNKNLQVVTAQTDDGWRAIKGMKAGRIGMKHVPAYEFRRNNGKLEFVKQVLVGEDDFIAAFTNKLDKEAMKEILPLIPSGGPSVPEGKLPI